MAATDGDGPLQIFHRSHRRRWVVGVVEEYQLGPSEDGLGNSFQIEQEIVLGTERRDEWLGPGQDGPAQIGLVPGLGDDGDVARVHHRERQVGQPFLRADQRQRLGCRVELEPEPPIHPAGGGLAEGRQSLLEPVLAVGGIAEGGGHGLHRGRRRRGVVVARAKVDDVHPRLDQSALQGRNLGERIARKRVQSLAEFDHRVEPS